MSATSQEQNQLQEWANIHRPAEDLIYKDGYWDQITFVRDEIPGILSRNYEELRAIQLNTKVVSTHRSKSVCLPVFRIELPDGTAFTMRYNFRDWKVSVESPREVCADFMGLFNPRARVNAVYCEGFPTELVYGPYAQNGRRFTIELPGGKQHIFTFFWIFAYQALGIRTRGE
jgi:hypothetical protein